MATTTSTSSTSSTSSSISSTSSSISSTSTSVSSTSSSTSSTSMSISSTSSSISTSSTSSSISSTSSSTSSTSSSSTSSSTSLSSTSSSVSSTSTSSTSTSSTSTSLSKSSTSTSFSSTSSSISSTSHSISSTSVSSTSSSSSTSTTVPINLDYTYQDITTLPTTNAELVNPFTNPQYQDVAADDGDYWVESGSKNVIAEYKQIATNNTNNINISWNGRTTVAPSSSPVLLQIYNYNTPAWETLASQTVVPTDTDFTMTGKQSANLSNYYDSRNTVSVRVYQVVV